MVQSQVRFNRVPENVLEKVSEKVGEALVQSQVVVRRRFRRRSGRVCLVQSQVRFNRVPEKVPKVPEKVWEVWCRARSSSTGFRRSFRTRCGRL